MLISCHSRTGSDFPGTFCHGAPSPAAPALSHSNTRTPEPGAAAAGHRGLYQPRPRGSAPTQPRPTGPGRTRPTEAAQPVTGPGRAPLELLEPPAAQPRQNGSHCHAGAGRPPRARDNRASSARATRRGGRGTMDAMHPTPPVPVPTIVPGTVRSLRPGPAPHNDCASQQTGKGLARRAAAAPALPGGAGPRARRAAPCRPGGPTAGGPSSAAGHGRLPPGALPALPAQPPELSEHGPGAPPSPRSPRSSRRPAGAATPPALPPAGGRPFRID